MPSTFDLDQTYIHLEHPTATELAVGADFWETIDQHADLSRGYLVMVGPMDATWTTWERHPAGEEIVYLLSGSVDFVLDLPDGEQTVELRGRALHDRAAQHLAPCHRARPRRHALRHAWRRDYSPATVSFAVVIISSSSSPITAAEYRNP